MRWVQRRSGHVEFWCGDVLSLGSGVTLVRTGGHFPGSTALHWHNGVHGGGALFVGDSPQVTMDRRGVSFMYSYPNHIPLRPADVRSMRERIAPFAYDDVYGFSWGCNIIGGGRAAIDASFERYLAIVAADREGANRNRTDQMTE